AYPPTAAQSCIGSHGAIAETQLTAGTEDAATLGGAAIPRRTPAAAAAPPGLVRGNGRVDQGDGALARGQPAAGRGSATAAPTPPPPPPGSAPEPPAPPSAWLSRTVLPRNSSEPLLNSPPPKAINPGPPLGLAAVPGAPSAPSAVFRSRTTPSSVSKPSL